MADDRVSIGDAVEVRVAFTNSWAAGFEIAEVSADSCRLRRRSDGQLLPDPTGFDDVRRPRPSTLFPEG